MYGGMYGGMYYDGMYYDGMYYGMYYGGARSLQSGARHGERGRRLQLLCK